MADKDSKNYYELLGLDPESLTGLDEDSFTDAIAEAVARLNLTKMSEEERKQVDDAIETLGNPERRQAYDETLKSRTDSADNADTPPAKNEKRSFSSLFNSVASARSIFKIGLTLATSLAFPGWGALAGVALTGIDFLGDYRRRENQDENWLAFAKKHKKKYARKLLGHALSAVAGWGLSEAFSLSDGFNDASMAETTTPVHEPPPAVFANSDTNVSVLDECRIDSIFDPPPSSDLGLNTSQDAVPIAEASISPQDKLASLLEDTQLSDRARSMVEAAQRGEVWAIRDVGIGLINGTYGFDNLDDFAGDMLPQEWGAQLLKEAAETGDQSAQTNYAYLQYHGIYGIKEAKGAALETIRETGAWVGGDALLDQANSIDTPPKSPAPVESPAPVKTVAIDPHTLDSDQLNALFSQMAEKKGVETNGMQWVANDNDEYVLERKFVPTEAHKFFAEMYHADMSECLVKNGAFTCPQPQAAGS